MQWEYHFLNVTAMDEWDDANKLKPLKVRLTACAQTAFQRLPDAKENQLRQFCEGSKGQVRACSSKDEVSGRDADHEKEKGSELGGCHRRPKSTRR